jgi:hypothetical protein
MKTYSSLLKQLDEKGISIKSSNYDEHLMGSWTIEIESEPVYRIVHDGRDKTIVLEVSDGRNDWTSLLADKTKSGRHVIAKLADKLKDL